MIRHDMTIDERDDHKKPAVLLKKEAHPEEHVYQERLCYEEEAAFIYNACGLHDFGFEQGVLEPYRWDKGRGYPLCRTFITLRSNDAVTIVKITFCRNGSSFGRVEQFVVLHSGPIRIQPIFTFCVTFHSC